LGRGEFLAWIREKWGEGILWNEPLSRHTSWKVGGPCDLMIFPRNLEELREIVEKASQEGEPLFVMGRGTNLLVLDGGIRGTVINLSRGLKEVVFEGERVRAGAGADLPFLAAQAEKRGLSGLEFAGGIPGTVGGGVKGNAGSFGKSIDQILKSLKIIDWLGQDYIAGRKDLEFSYRRFNLPCAGVIVEAEFGLQKEELEAIRKKTKDLQKERRRRQPLRSLTAGSVFKNPPGAHAGQIIESLGLKGKIMGQAKICDLHANFIENLGEAKAVDLLGLIALIRGKAEMELGLNLELEVQIVGEK
jgi:UDP-N-acetylmuramate dehydrogenase